MIRPVAFLVAALLGLTFLAFLGERIWFLSRAEKTTAEVTSLDRRDARCGGRRRARYDCTRFQATARFETTAGETRTTRFSAGSARRHGQPISEADYRIGEGVEILYDRQNPQKVVRNTFWHLWGVTFFAGIGHVFVLLRGLFGHDERD